MSDTATDGVSGSGGIYTSNEKRVVNTPYEDASTLGVSVNDFLQLMIAQLKNQDFMNPMDDTQYVTQLAQFATMQQMQELAYYSKSNYVMSLVGKEVTAASLSLGGSVSKVTGPVEKVALSNKEFMIYVNGKGYNLSQIMEVNNPETAGDSELDNVTKITPVVMQKDDASATIRWDPATDDEELQEKMMYSVYYSTNRDFDTLTQVKSGTLVGTANTPGLDEIDITGLEPGTTYFVNIVVKTPGGKEQVYQKLTFTTDED